MRSFWALYFDSLHERSPTSASTEVEHVAMNSVAVGRVDSDHDSVSG